MTLFYKNYFTSWSFDNCTGYVKLNLFILGLINNTVNSSDYTELNEKISE
jgi:hypothetical protein